jgi:hypothetical protein
MSFLSWISGYDSENAARAADADAELRAINEERAKTLGSAWKAQVDKNYASQPSFDPSVQQAEIGKAFDEGLDDGAKNVTGFFGGIFDVVGKGLGAILKAIPWWVWLGLVVYFLYTTGIGQRLIAKAAGK